MKPLVIFYGGSREEKHVLDLGCCQGVWSINARWGGTRCIGIDSSETFVREAHTVAEVLGVANCDFSYFRLEYDSLWQDLDAVHITFFLGLFYHLADPIFVFRKAAGLTLETMVIDTETVVEGGSYLKIGPRDPEEFTKQKFYLTTKLRAVRTKQALCDFLSDQGFADFQCLQPDASMPTEYLSGHRMSLIASR